MTEVEMLVKRWVFWIGGISSAVCYVAIFSLLGFPLKPWMVPAELIGGGLLNLATQRAYYYFWPPPLPPPPRSGYENGLYE